MRSGVIVQARSGSSRLPGKVLLPFGDGSVLDQVISRCQDAREPELVAVATTTAASDDAIDALCAARGIRCIRGSEHDVLDRYREATEQLGLDVVARVTADCPFIWGGDIDAVISALLVAGDSVDYASNAGAPDGLGVEAAWGARLIAAALEAVDPYDREHVMPYLYRREESKVVEAEPTGGKHPDLRVTLDTAADYGFLCALLGRSMRSGETATPQWIISAVQSPELAHWQTRVKGAVPSTAGTPAESRSEGCEVCEILEGLGDAGHQLNGGWVLNGNIDPRTARPALVLSTSAHREHLSDLNDAEATWLGRNIRRIDGPMRKATGAIRTQVLLFNEAEHVHFHLVPRYRNDDPSLFGPQLLTSKSPEDSSTGTDVAAEVAASALSQ